MTQDTNKVFQDTAQINENFVIGTSVDSILSETANNKQNDSINPGKSDTVVKEKNLQKFFTGKESIKKEIAPIKITSINNDWILGIIILCAVLYSFVHTFYHKRILQIYSAFGARHYANQVNREGNLYNERISIPLLIIFFLSFSLFLVQAFIFFIDEENLFFQAHIYYIIICLLLLVFWFAKIFIILVISKIFHTEKMTKEYLLNMLIYTAITGIIILPINILIIYSHNSFFIYVGIIITSLIIIYWLIRGFIIGLSYQNYSSLHLFIYLCSLEILPLIVITKMVIRNCFI